MLKKLLLCVMMGVLSVTAFACGNSNDETTTESTTASQSEETTTEAQTDDSAEGKKSLVVYFSWSGNTKNVAEAIQKETDSDIFEIVPATSYTKDYNDLLDDAQKEQEDDARPKIKDKIDNIDDYDTIYLGYPNWWGDMPMIIYSFLDDYDLSGKTIAPFCTSGGSGFSDSISTITSMEKDATVLADGLHIGDSDSDNPDSAVKDWIKQIGTK